MLSHRSVVRSFSVLGNISFCGFIPVYLSINKSRSVTVFADKHSGCSQCEAIIDNAAINIVQLF